MMKTTSKQPAETSLDSLDAAWKRERPDLDLSAAILLLRIERSHLLHVQRLAAISKAIGVNIGDMHVLLALRRSGEPYALRPTELFRSLLVTSGAMTKRMSRLEKDRYVERKADPNDRRSELVSLTKKGFNLAEKALIEISQGLRVVIEDSGLSRKDIQMMDEFMRRLLSKMPESNSKIVKAAKSRATRPARKRASGAASAEAL
jgi:DNA-binding MarR family transcriptional regulator